MNELFSEFLLSSYGKIGRQTVKVNGTTVLIGDTLKTVHCIYTIFREVTYESLRCRRACHEFFRCTKTVLVENSIKLHRFLKNTTRVEIIITIREENCMI